MPNWMRFAYKVLLVLSLIGLAFSASKVFAQDCWPTDTAVGPGYYVLVDDARLSNHSSERTAMRAARRALGVDPFATVSVRSDIRVHWPVGCEPTPDSTPPTIPTGVSVMGYTSADDWGTQLTWAAQPADSFRVFGGANAGGSDWSAIVPGTATSARHAETYTDTTPIFGCVIAYRSEQESPQQCDGMELAPMPPGSWGTP